MKWLLLFGAVHGIQFSDDQCRVLRQVRLVAPECQSHFANPRNVAANYAGGINATRAAASSGAAHTGGPAGTGGSIGGGPSNSPGTGGVAGAGSGSPSGGSPSGSPGNPGGGGSAPGSGLGGSPIEPSPKPPPITAADIAKIKGEIRDALRQRTIDRIINGPKPPARPTQPGRPSFGDKPGLGRALGPGGLRGASSSGTPSRDRNGQAR